MSEIQFYHLITTPLERALPKLMEKSLKAGMRAIIRVADDAMLARLNDELWTYEERSFLPHGCAKDGDAERQPIYLTTTDENPNSAQVLVITDGTQLEQTEPFSKILDMFDGHTEEAVAAARTRWKAYQQQGHTVRYIKQQPGGGWKDMTQAA